MKAPILTFSIILLTQSLFANGLSRGGIGCRVGGFLESDEPAIVYYQKRIVVGEINAVQIFDLTRRQLDDAKLPDGAPVTAGAATRSRVYLGTRTGLFVSSDLRTWKPIDALKGKSVGALRVIGDTVWVGLPGELVRMREEDIVKRYPIDDQRVVVIAPLGNKVLFGGVKPGPAPAGYCEPHLVSEGLQFLEPSSGGVSLIPSARRAQEQAPEHVTTVASKPIVVFSDNFMSHVAYELDPTSLSLATTTMAAEPNFAAEWVVDNAEHLNAALDLADIFEHLYPHQDYLQYWRVWNDAFRWLHANGESPRLKRMYIAASPRNKEEMIKWLGAKKIGDMDESFAKELLTLAIDRHEYFREEVARAVESHQGEAYDDLLLRILREAAPIAPDSIGKNIAIPFPCPSGQAADGLLKRMGGKAIPLIEAVAEARTTNPVVQGSLRHRLQTYSITNLKRAYKIPAQLRSEGATGADALTMLDDKDPYVRFQAIQHLKATPNLVPLSKLVALLDDGNDVAAQAVMVMTDSNDPGASDALLKVLDSSRVPVRVWALIGLGKRGDNRAYDSMIKGLSDSNADVRSAAARGLRFLKDPRATDALQHALNDANWDVRNESAQALKAISQQ